MPNNFAPSLTDMWNQVQDFQNYVREATSGKPVEQNYHDFASGQQGSFADIVRRVMEKQSGGEPQQGQTYPQINSFTQTSNFEQPNAPKPEGESDIETNGQKKDQQQERKDKNEPAPGTANKVNFDSFLSGIINPLIAPLSNSPMVNETTQIQSVMSQNEDNNEGEGETRKGNGSSRPVNNTNNLPGDTGAGLGAPNNLRRIVNNLANNVPILSMLGHRSGMTPMDFNRVASASEAPGNEEQPQEQQQQQPQQQDNSNLALPGDTGPRVVNTTNTGTLSGIRDFVNALNGRNENTGEGRTQGANADAADTHNAEASQAQESPENTAQATLGIVNGRPVIGDNFNADNFYADYQNYARNNGMEGRDLYDFMVNGTEDEWRALLSDPYMAQYYDADYATYGDLANNDEAFRDYWEYYKGSDVNQVMDPESEFWFARNIYDDDLINDINAGALRDGYLNSNVINYNDNPEYRQQLIDAINEDPQGALAVANYMTLRNLLATAKPGEADALDTDELNNLAIYDQSIFGSAEDNGGNQPEVRGNYEQYLGAQPAIDYSAMMNPDVMTPAAGLADLVSHAKPGYGIIGQKQKS